MRLGGGEVNRLRSVFSNETRAAAVLGKMINARTSSGVTLTGETMIIRYISHSRTTSLIRDSGGGGGGGLPRRAHYHLSEN